MSFDQALFDKARQDGGEGDPEAALRTLADLSAVARKDGLLALEARAEGLEPFVAAGLRAIVDGTDPETLRNELVGGLEADGVAGRRLLERMMAIEGLMAIQAGAGASAIELRLAAYLGPDRLAEALERAAAETPR